MLSPLIEKSMNAFMLFHNRREYGNNVIPANTKQFKNYAHFTYFLMTCAKKLCMYIMFTKFELSEVATKLLNSLQYISTPPLRRK